MFNEIFTTGILHKLTGITVIRDDLCPIEIRVKKNGRHIVNFPNGGPGTVNTFSCWKEAKRAIKEWTNEHSTRQCRVIYPLIWK